MNQLKSLIKEVEFLNAYEDNHTIKHEAELVLQGIKQTVEAVDNVELMQGFTLQEFKDWQTLKKLLGIK